MTQAWKKWVILSVIGNALLLGVIGGHAYKHFSRDHWRHGHHDKAALEQYPADRVEEVRTKLKTLWKAHKPDRGEYKALKKQATELLKAEPFDREAYAQVVQQIHDQRSTMMQGFTDSLVALASSLSREERGILAELMKRPPRHDRRPPPPEHHGDNKKGHPPHHSPEGFDH